MGLRRLGLRLTTVAALGLGPALAQAQTPEIELSRVNEGNDWAAGCDTDSSGTEYCAIQKSNGPQALGYVVMHRADGAARQIRISVNSMLIDAAQPVTIQVDDNEPLVWDVGYRVIERNLITLIGQEMDALIQQLQTGVRVVVTVVQKTGDPIMFELALDGFSDAIAALERATGTAAAD